jgi:hypothetical protein
MFVRSFAALVLAVATGTLVPAAQQQEEKPVPKDSIRVAIPGCSKSQVFTAGTAAVDRPAGTVVPEGTRLRMNGSKKLMSEIKAQEGTQIEITGLVKRGQIAQDGVGLGGGVRVGGGYPVSGSGGMPSPGGGQLMIDVEGWRALDGRCGR